MKNNKMLKVTGIMQSVLIGILLLFAICIEVMSRMNFYTYDYSLNFDYSSFWAIHGDYPFLFIFNTLFTTFASFSSLLENYVLYVILKLWILHRWYCPYISFTNPYAVKARWQTD